jgi:hypothetical protein
MSAPFQPADPLSGMLYLFQMTQNIGIAVAPQSLQTDSVYLRIQPQKAINNDLNRRIWIL